MDDKEVLLCAADLLEERCKDRAVLALREYANELDPDL